jgi:hypothetical protein
MGQLTKKREGLILITLPLSEFLKASGKYSDVSDGSKLQPKSALLYHRIVSS